MLPILIEDLTCHRWFPITALIIINFKWDNIEILDIESSYNKRLISEMIHIKRQKHGINKQNDTESLQKTYSNISLSLSFSLSLSLSLSHSLTFSFPFHILLSPRLFVCFLTHNVVRYFQCYTFLCSNTAQ